MNSLFVLCVITITSQFTPSTLCKPSHTSITDRYGFLAGRDANHHRDGDGDDDEADGGTREGVVEELERESCTRGNNTYSVGQYDIRSSR